jgi:hypothetical protein
MPPTTMIRVVSSRTEIASLDPGERVVHLTFPHPAVALFELMRRCHRLKAIEYLRRGILTQNFFIE